jgi:hypothetical protein
MKKAVSLFNFMDTFRFTLELRGDHLDIENLANPLYESGCSDALLGQKDSLIYMDFERDALSQNEAIASAIADIARANLGLKIYYNKKKLHPQNKYRSIHDFWQPSNPWS